MVRLRQVSIALALAVGLSLLSTGVPQAQADGVVNAIGAYNSNWWGTRADIETALPQIRDGGWSWARASVQYNPAGHNDYAEVGWYKTTLWRSVYVSVQNGASHFESAYSYFPLTGSTHKYTVTWSTSGQCWRLLYDGTQVTCRASSVALTRIFSGGEASSSQNAIGISGCLNNQYQATSGGSWYNYPDHYPAVEPGGVYWLARISNRSWQVGGNN
jgi:hypothetical protein